MQKNNIDMAVLSFVSGIATYTLSFFIQNTLYGILPIIPAVLHLLGIRQNVYSRGMVLAGSGMLFGVFSLVVSFL